MSIAETVYKPASVTVRQRLVSPLTHVPVIPSGRQRVLESPRQIESNPEIKPNERGITLTYLLQYPLQPLSYVSVMAYRPAFETVMQLVLSPVLHQYSERPGGRHNVVESPIQMESFPVIKQTDALSMVINLLQVLTQPFISVTVMAYNPASVTVIHGVV